MTKNKELSGTTKEAAEKVRNADPSRAELHPTKRKNGGSRGTRLVSPLGMTKTKGLCGTAEAVPFQNITESDFFSIL